MNSEAVHDIVRRYILSEFLPDEDPSVLLDQTPLITSGVLDSIGTAKLVATIEERFAIRFAAHEVNPTNLDTIDRIVETVLRKVGG